MSQRKGVSSGRGEGASGKRLLRAREEGVKGRKFGRGKGDASSSKRALCPGQRSCRETKMKAGNL